MSLITFFVYCKLYMSCPLVGHKVNGNKSHDSTHLSKEIATRVKTEAETDTLAIKLFIIQ